MENVGPAEKNESTREEASTLCPSINWADTCQL